VTVFLRTAILFALFTCALAPAAAAAPAGNEYFPKNPSATGKDDDGGGDEGGSGGSGSDSSDDESGSGAIGSDPGSGSGGTGSAAAPKDKPKAEGSIVPGVGAGTPTLPDGDSSAATSSASDDEGALDTLLNPLPLALIAVALIVGAGFLLRWRSGREAEGAGLRGTGRRAPPVPDPKGN
jgi:hypothetical protein